MRAMSGGLCPACLIAAALSQDDEPCPYRVLAPIDEDASGITYFAQALSGTHGYVALKIHDRHHDLDAVLDRYERWKPALARVDHVSLARLVDIGVTAEGLLYVASEFVVGWPLSVLGSYDLSPEVRAALAAQLAETMQAAHAAGLAHLSLDATKVKVSTAAGPRATILGLGVRMIVDGAEPAMDHDLRALTDLTTLLVSPS